MGRSTVGAAVQRDPDGLQGSAKTRDHYHYVARSRILPRLAGVPLDVMVTSDVSAWLRGLQQGDSAYLPPAHARPV